MRAYLRSTWHRVAVVLLTFAPVMAAVPAGSQAPQPTPFEWRELGARVFGGSCMVCHQENGLGVAGAFPPLAGHVAEAFGRREGRDYLVRVMLFGLSGAIDIKGTAFDGMMPPWAQLGDNEIAAVLDHVLTAWGNDRQLPADFVPIAPADVAAARAQPMTAEQVLALRGSIAPGAAPGGATAGTASPRSVPRFTAEQVENGRAVYRRNCQDCHGSELDNGEFGGAPLRGSIFRRHWESGSVAALYSKTKATMPPDRPGQLSEGSYVDVTAFLLSENGYAVGNEPLTTDLAAQQVMSLKK